MSPEENAWQWWNWSVQAATALATLGAVAVALFGNWARLRLFPPKLCIGLLSTESEEIPTSLQDPNPFERPHLTKSRWFHIKVTNARAWVEATDVQVFLVRVEEPNAAGLFTIVPWAGEAPLKWRHMEANPATTRTVGGHSLEADLVAFFKDAKTRTFPFLQLQPVYVPNRMDPVRRAEHKPKLRLVLVARERQVKSNHLTIQIDWNGEWPETDEHAKRCIVVREVAPS
jgi:hypothetical protein